MHELKSRPGSEKLMDICGEPLSTYPSVTKLLWLLKHKPEVREVFDRGDLAFGTIDAWLIYKLNGGAKNNVFVSDPTNAARTMFMDIRSLEYSDHMRKFFSYEFDLSKVSFPQNVKSSDPEAFGALAEGSLKGFKITGCLGDQSAALVGQKGFQVGDAKNTYGTCRRLLSDLSTDIIRHRLLPLIQRRRQARHLQERPALHRGLRLWKARLRPGGIHCRCWLWRQVLDDEPQFWPQVRAHFATGGRGGRCWRARVRDCLFRPLCPVLDRRRPRHNVYVPSVLSKVQLLTVPVGITQHTQTGHIARATLEAVCYQTKAILDAMAKDSSQPLASLKVDGGMSNSALTMQTQADVTGIPIIRPKMRETTALGAAIAAGLAVGVWKDLNALDRVNVEGETRFERKIPDKAAGKMFARWERAVQMTRGWVQDDEELAEQ